MSVRLLIADDHEVVRAGLHSLLAGTEFDIVGEATTGEEAVRAARDLVPDVVLLDVRMTDCDGLSALDEIKQQRPELPVLMFSAYDNPTYVARASALGAAGYVLKRRGHEELLAALRQAAAGKSAWRRDDLRRVTGALATPRADLHLDAPLTQRESEVLRQIALGLTNREISKALGISYETVKEHVQHVLRKLGVNDRTQAAVWAVRHGML